MLWIFRSIIWHCKRTLYMILKENDASLRSGKFLPIHDWRTYNIPQWQASNRTTIFPVYEHFASFTLQFELSIFHRCIFVSMHCIQTTMLINSSDCKIKENNKWENFSTLKSILYALNRNTNSKRSIHSFISNWWSRERPFESFYGGCCCSARVLLPSSMFMCGLAPKKKHTTTTDISNIFSLQNIRYLWCFLGNSVLLC